MFVLLGECQKQNPSNTSVSSPGEKPKTEPAPVGQSVTVQGTTYNNVEVRNVYPRSLFVRHAKGTAFIDRLGIDPKDAALLGVEPIRKSSALKTQVVTSSEVPIPRPAPTPGSRSPQSDKPAAPGLVKSAPSLSRNVFDEMEEAALAAKVAAPASRKSKVTFPATLHSGHPIPVLPVSRIMAPTPRKSRITLPATLHSGDPVPVLPAGRGVYYAPIYAVTDAKGVRHTGVVYGDDKYSITIPRGGGTRTIRFGNLIIPLD